MSESKSGAPTMSMIPVRDEVALELDRAKVWAGLFKTPLPCIDRFTIVARIGTGGMGDVYAARDEKLGRDVAIKLVRAALKGQKHEERLLREAQTMARLSHPNVVQVYEVGEYRDRVYIAMEFIRGQTLRAWLAEQARKGTGRAYQRAVLDLFTDAGRGLQAAHDAELVHRDFKPENVLIGDDDRPRVGDFGLARVHASTADARARGITQPLSAGDGTQTPSVGSASSNQATSQIAGTPLYMAPEQLLGQTVDKRADQYSFCVALYEALFQADPVEARTAGEQQKLLRTRSREVAPAIRKALLRGLSHKPADRFADMNALLRQLRVWPGWWRRRMVGLAAGLGVIAVSLGLCWDASPVANPCADAGQEITELWNPERAKLIARSFADTGHPDASDVWRSAAQEIARYTDTWSQTHVDMCQRTHGPNALSPEMADRSKNCLEQGKVSLAAMLTRLENSDSPVVPHVTDFIDQLPALQPCTDWPLLRAGQEAPLYSEWAAVRRIRERLAEVRTMELLGEYESAQNLAQNLLDAAELLNYRPIKAHALHLTGRLMLRDDTSDASAKGEAKMKEAIDIADGERALVRRADVWVSLMQAGARHRRPIADVRTWSKRALIASRAINDPPRVKAEILRHLGVAERDAEQYRHAEQLQRQGLKLIDGDSADSDSTIQIVIRARHLHDLGNTVMAPGPTPDRIDEAWLLYLLALDGYPEAWGEHHPEVLDLRFDLAMLDIDEGHYYSARATLEQLEQRFRVIPGSTHPHLGRALLSLAELDRRDGKLDRAERRAREALSIYLATYRPTDRKLAFAHTGLATIAFSRGDYQDAVESYQTALAIEIEHFGVDSEAVAITHLNLAEALLRLQRHQDALAAVTSAASALAQTKKPVRSDIVDFLTALRGHALLGLGDPAEAHSQLDFAARRLAAAPGMNSEFADAAWALAQSKSPDGIGADEQAISLARTALDIYQAQTAEVATPKDEVKAWLDAAEKP